MQKKWLSLLQYLLFFGLGIFLVWWSLQQIPKEKWADFKLALESANYWLMLPVILILSASHLLRALRWKILMQPMGFSPKLPNVFFAVMIGYLANLAIPRLGEVLKCTILSKYEKVPVEKLVGTILVERVFDVICLGIVFVIALSTQYNIIGEYTSELFNGLFANRFNKLSSFWSMALVLSLAIIAIALFTTIIKRYPQNKVSLFINKITKGILEGLTSIRHLQKKGYFIVYSLFIWVLYIAGTWIGLMATEGTAHLGLPTAISALAFASIGMIITPGGIGAYAFFMAKVLEKNNIPFEIGFANGTMQWFAQFLIVLIVGFCCLGLIPWYNKKNIPNESH